MIATSVADSTVSGAATVTVTAATATISVAITPPSAALQTGSTQQFSATVTGTSNTAVTWSASRGSISSAGLYTAPNTAGTYTVKATSVADTTKTSTATVTVTSTPPPVGIFINPTSASVQTGATQQFTATVTGTSNKSVTWSATGGSVSTLRLVYSACDGGQLHGEGDQCCRCHKIRIGDRNCERTVDRGYDQSEPRCDSNWRHTAIHCKRNWND